MSANSPATPRSTAIRTTLALLLGVAVLAGGIWLARRPAPESQTATLAHSGAEPSAGTAAALVVIAPGATLAGAPAPLPPETPTPAAQSASAEPAPAAATPIPPPEPPTVAAAAVDSTVPVATAGPVPSTEPARALASEAKGAASRQGSPPDRVTAPPSSLAALNPDPAPAPVPRVQSNPAPAASPAAAAESSPISATPVEQAPSFDVVRVSPRGEAIIAGRAAPNADVTLLDNGREVARTRADDGGQWVALPATALPSGGQQLTVAATSPGGPERVGEAPVLVVVPPARTSAPAKSANSKPADAKPADAKPATMKPADAGPEAKALVMLMPPGQPPRLLQRPVAEPSVGRGKLGLDVVDYDEHGAIRFGGSGVPGAHVRLYVDNAPLGEAVVDAHGDWGLAPSTEVAAGDHRLRVDAIGKAGQVTARVELPFQRALLSAQTVLEGRVIVQPRQNLWRIARRSYGHGTRYTVIYAANRDQIRDPNLIYPGQVFAVPTLTGLGSVAASNPASGSLSRSR